MKGLTLTLLVTACGGRMVPFDHDASATGANDATVEPDAQVEDLDATNADADAGPFVLPDVAELAPCQNDDYIFYVDGTDYPGIDGSAQVTGAQGTWAAGLTNEAFLQVSAIVGQTWTVVAFSDWYQGQSLTPGTYWSVGADKPGATIQIGAAGAGCPTTPVGTFTIVALDAPSGDQVDVSRVALWFDVSCMGQGSLRGCVRYGN